MTLSIEDVAQQLKAKRYGDDYRSKCPAHHDKHPSLWFRVKAGKIYFQCKAGCDFMSIRQAIGLRGKVKVEDIPDPHDPILEQQRRAKLHKVWNAAEPIDLASGSPAALYLTQVRRVLDVGDDCPAVMRQTVEDIDYWEAVENDCAPVGNGYICNVGSDVDFVSLGKYPAIITRLDNRFGELTTIHRTFLAADGTKAPVPKPKKLMQSPYPGCTSGSAIKLFPPSDGVLGIAEGIETALAVVKLSGVPCWAAWSASGLYKVDVPDDVTDLVIFTDFDKSGQDAAGKLQRRMEEERVGLKVRLQLPTLKGSDFADELLSQYRRHRQS